MSGRRIGTALVTAACAAAVCRSARADYLYGTRYDGSVTQVNTATRATSTYVSGLTGGAGGLVFDAAGDLYVTDYANNAIDRFTPGGVRTTFATGLVNPSGLAMDTGGNLYVAEYADATAGAVERITPAGVGTVVASGLDGPINLAFDRTGDLFVANYSGTIDRITPAGTLGVFAAGLNGPVGLAFAADGDLYVGTDSDEANQSILRFTPDGVESTFASTSPYFPTGLAFDSEGNLYAGHDGDGTVSEFSPGGTQKVLATGGSDTISYLAVRTTAVPEPATATAVVIATVAGGGLGRRRRPR